MKVTVKVGQCRKCGRDLIVEVEKEHLENYINSKMTMLIQEAFPELSPGEREYFLTGYCETCWDKIFETGEEV